LCAPDDLKNDAGMASLGLEREERVRDVHDAPLSEGGVTILVHSKAGADEKTGR